MTKTTTNRAAQRAAARRLRRGRSFDQLSFDQPMYRADIAEAGARAEGGTDAPDGGGAADIAA